MKTRCLGRTGLNVSILGFGGAPLGGHYGPTNDADNIAAVRHAIDRGINFIDTSPYYSETRSETILGQALAKSDRDRVILTTKGGRYDIADFDFSARRMLAGLEESLRRLRTDHVDIWFAHDIEFAPDFDAVFSETLAAMHRARDAGKCRFVGMTGYPPALLARAIERCDLDVVLNYCHHSLTNRQMLPELGLIAAKTGCGLCNASALMMGLLASKGPPAWHPAPEALKSASRQVVAACQRCGFSPESVALAFALQDERIATTLVGMESVAEVDINLKSLEAPLDGDLLREISAIVEPVRDQEWPSGNWPGKADSA